MTVDNASPMCENVDMTTSATPILPALSIRDHIMSIMRPCDNCMAPSFADFCSLECAYDVAAGPLDVAELADLAAQLYDALASILTVA